MKRQLFAFLALLSIAGQATAKMLVVENQAGQDIVDVTVTYCRGTKVTQVIHRNHQIDLGAIDDNTQASVHLESTKKIRLQKISVTTADGKVVTYTFPTFRNANNKIELNKGDVVVIKADGIYRNDVKLEATSSIINKSPITRKAAIALVAAQAA